MKERRPYSRTGLNALKARVKIRGLSAIDKRTSAARALLAWRQDLIQDLGGTEAISAQQEVIVDIVVRTKLMLDSLDAWILSQKSLINKRKRAVLPVVRERSQIADSLARQLQMLGLARRAKIIPPLQIYLKERKSKPKNGEEAKALSIRPIKEVAEAKGKAP